MGPMYPSICRLPATSIASFAALTPAIFHQRHITIRFHHQSPPTRLSFRFRPILSLQPARRSSEPL